MQFWFKQGLESFIIFAASSFTEIELELLNAFLWV